MMNIHIEQAVYGEKDKGHALLNHSFKDSEIPNSIILKTDLPSGHTSFPSWKCYYGGITLKQYYVLLKIFPDSDAHRSAFVYTYALFIESDDLNLVKDLKHLIDLFPNKIDKHFQSRTLDLNILQMPLTSIKNYDKVKKVAYGLVNKKSPIVWVGEKDFIETIAIVWNNFNSELRRNFQFRASFRPKDIEKSNEQIICTPTGLKDKWEKYFIIDENDSFDFDYTDPIKYIVEGREVATSLASLIESLHLSLTRISDLNNISLLSSLLKSEDVNDLLNALALAVMFSPNKSKGKELKDTLLKKINHSLLDGNIQHVLSLRNIKIDYLPLSNPFQASINIVLQKEFSYSVNYELKKQLLLSIKDVDVELWWIKVIDQFLTEYLRVWGEKHSELFWQVVENDYSLFEIISNYIPIDENVENSILQQTPNKLSSNSVNTLIEFAKGHNWFLLHAEISGSYFSPKEAIESQLQIDTNKKNLEGLKIISKKVPGKLFIEYSINNPEERLINLSTALTIDSESLMNDIDPDNSYWLKIWNNRTLKQIKPFSGIKSPKKVLHKLLDRLLIGKDVPLSLLESISKSKYADLSDYANRSTIWSLLPDESCNGFLSITAQVLLKKYLNSPNSFQIEKEIKTEIYTNNYLDNLLKEETYANENIILLIINIEEFSEQILISYLEKNYITFNKNACILLGNLLKHRKWSNTYKKVKKDYIKLNTNFRETIKICVGSFPLIDSPLFHSLSRLFSKENSNEPENSYMNQDTTQRKTVLILTAIDVEFKAVKSFVQSYSEEKHPKTGTIYGSGVYGSAWNIKIVETEAGNSNAAIEAQRAIDFFKPEYVFFIGIAGGLKDVKIGDVVIASKVYAYEFGKANENYMPRFEFGQPSYAIKEIAKSLRRDDNWLSDISLLLSDEIGKDIKVKAYFKPIAAGEKVIGYTKSDIFKFIKQNAGDSLAVEMEGYGFLRACYAYDDIQYILIRGISDLIDNKGQTDDEGSQELASLTASAFAFEILNRIENNYT